MNFEYILKCVEDTKNMAKDIAEKFDKRNNSGSYMEKLSESLEIAKK